MCRLAVVEVLGITGVIAVGLGAMRAGTEIWRLVISSVTIVALMIGLLGAFVASRPREAWIGFAVFGWASFLLFGQAETNLKLQPLSLEHEEYLTDAILTRLSFAIHRPPPVPSGYIGGANPRQLREVRQGIEADVSATSPPHPRGQGVLRSRRRL